MTFEFIELGIIFLSKICLGMFSNRTGILGTNLIHLSRMKGCIDHGINQYDRVSITAP